MSYPISPLSPYFGALVIQCAHVPFYKFIDLSLMVCYQLESLHLDDYNLIYSQNKNRGFDKILTAFPLKTQHFPFTNITQTTPTKNTLQNSTQHNPKTHLKPRQNSFYPRLGFSPTSKSQKMKPGFCFLTLASSNLHF